jgi:hypothetical protein
VERVEARDVSYALFDIAEHTAAEVRRFMNEWITGHLDFIPTSRLGFKGFLRNCLRFITIAN